MQKIWKNPRYRYLAYIEAVEKLSLQKETKELLLDWFFRLAEGCEQKNECSAADYDLQVRIEEILQGKYGSEQAKAFDVLSESRRQIAARYMLLQEKAGESVMLYGKALTALLLDGVLYKNRRNPSELLLYLGKEKNLEDEAAIAFANREFLPFGYKLVVYYQESFGIIGDSRCMDLDGILLY